MAARQHASHSLLEIYPPFDPIRLNRGAEVGVYYGSHEAGEWPRHQREQLEIVFFFEASIFRVGWLAANDHRSELEIRGRQICVIAPKVAHECRLEGHAEILVLYVEPEPLARFGRNRITAVNVVETAEQDIALWMLAALLRHVCTRRTRPKPRTIDAFGCELASELVDLLHGPKTSPPKGCGLMPRDREKVFQFIRTNLKYDIHVADLAKQTGHSVGHFAELFINTTGRPPYHYLQEARLLRGHELLLTGDYNVKEVAERVGYSDANHFSELFRSFTGYPPRDVLRRIRTGPVNLPV